mmetsp:Transcript_62609/g.183095  ORF Transcript_62609/g.183095 Transcript_62609/m.183095 type:complete len:128 (+) Transcript_62609:113-496(+)
MAGIRALLVAALTALAAASHNLAARSRAAFLVQEAKAQREALEAQAAMPNGPLLMNLTKMDAAALPQGSRHVSNATLTADWMTEYPALQTAAAPEAAPALMPSVQSSAALAVPVLVVLTAATVVSQL